MEVTVAYPREQTSHGSYKHPQHSKEETAITGRAAAVF
jgi:hypothetical protein